MNRRKRAVAIAVLVLACGWLTSARAQDSHYWNNQYGTRAQLLGGVVVGTTLDLSSTFYNPGAGAMQLDPNLVLSSDAIEFSTVELRDGAGQGIDLRTTRSGTAPSIFTVRLTMDWLGDNAVAISYLTRHDFDISLGERSVGDRDVLPRNPGDEAYAGEIEFTQKGRETWYGLSWSRQAGENIGVGITQYVAYRSQESRAQTILQAVTPGGDGAAIVDVNAFEFWNARILWKLGAFARFGNLGMGVSLTTPSINLFGNGSAYANASTINLALADSTLSSTLASHYQRDIPSHYESPISIGIGASYALGATTLYTSAEWFDKVDSYDVLDRVETPEQSTGPVTPIELRQRLDSVTNVGGGVSHKFSQHLELYAAFTTDRSASVSREETQLSVTGWDIHHVTVGSAFTVQNFDFTLGVSRSSGKQSFEPDVDIASGNDKLAQTRIADARYRRWLFIVGLSFPL